MDAPVLHAPLLHALYIAIATFAIAFATSRGRIHPFLAVVAAATGFAYACGMSVSLLGKVFGTGFGQALNMLGLPVLAAAMIGVMAERSFASASLMARAARWPAPARSGVLACMGLAAGTGASAGGAFAVLAPLRVALSAGLQRRGAVTTGLAIEAGQGLLLPSPVVIAATAILAASWVRVLAFGVPVALLVTVFSAALAARIAPDHAQSPETGDAPASARIALVAACLVMALMLAVQSIGDIPSEPLGGGGARETILGTGRPLVLLLAGVAIMIAGARAWRNNGLSETGWPAQAISRAAPLMLLLGAAGGLQALAQNTHMSELLAERVSALAVWPGRAVPGRCGHENVAGIISGGRHYGRRHGAIVARYTRPG
jgi:GntP family gluconate:H+ symporter